MTMPITPWASLPVNYPAGANPWNGLPTKIAPAAMYFSPNIPIPAQVLNWLFNRQDTSIGQLASASWIAAVSNWNPVDTNVGNLLSGNDIYCASWDPWYSQWIVGGISGVAAPNLQATYDGGKTWFSLLPGLSATNAYVPIAIVCSTVDGTMAVIRMSPTAVAGEITSFTGGSGSRSSTDTAQAWMAPGGALVDQGVGFFWNSTFYFVGGTGFTASSFTGAFAASVTASGTWTDLHTSLPGAWQTGTNHIQQYLAAQSASAVVVAMCGVTPATDTSRLMVQTLTSAWADITPAFLSGTAKQIRGLAYSANDQIWGVLCVDGSHTSYLYTSPDLTTWTLVHTFTGFDSGGLATIGSVWAALIYEFALGEPGGNRVCFSPDVAANGATSSWFFADYADAATLSSVTTPGSLLLSSGTQLLRAQLFGSGLGSLIGVGGVVACSLKAGFAFTATVGPGGSGGGGGGSGLAFEVNGVPIANNPHVTLNYIQSGATGTDAGGGVAQINATAGGTLGRVDVNHASTGLTLTAQQRAFVDVSAGVVTVNAPAAPADGAEIAVKNSAGDCSVNPITVSGNGHNIEDPSNLGTFAASVVLRSKGEATNWQFSTTTSTWEAV